MRKGSRAKTHAIRIVVSALFLTFALPVVVAGWPLTALEIRETDSATQENEKRILHTPALLGTAMSSMIVHSVQLTPVIDEYRIQEGRIWAWREHIMSHNAGLPSLRPEQGRFVYDPPWMIVEGTGESWSRFIYRVGTEALGKNVLCVSSLPCRELWREMPGARLLFLIVPARL